MAGGADGLRINGRLSPTFLVKRQEGGKRSDPRDRSDKNPDRTERSPERDGFIQVRGAHRFSSFQLTHHGGNEIEDTSPDFSKNMSKAAPNHTVAIPTLRHATIMLMIDNRADIGETSGQNLSASFCPELFRF